MAVHQITEAVVNHPAAPVTSFGVLGATLMNILPPIASILSIVWICLNIYFKPEVQEWLKKKGWIKKD